MPLSQIQEKALEDYLSNNPQHRPKCGHNDLEFGEIEETAAEIYLENRKIEQSGPSIEIICRSCGAAEVVDGVQAGLIE